MYSIINFEKKKEVCIAFFLQLVLIRSNCFSWRIYFYKRNRHIYGSKSTFKPFNIFK